jgi:hypothetical protein
MKSQLRICFILLVSIFGLFSAIVQAGGSDETLCPSKDFSKFLAAYAESYSVQEKFTNMPLKKTITVDAEPEPKQVITFLEKTQIVFPILPDEKHRTESGLKLQMVDNASGMVAVKLEKPDTDYQIIYIFKLSSCWFLDEVKDYSL